MSLAPSRPYPTVTCGLSLQLSSRCFQMNCMIVRMIIVYISVAISNRVIASTVLGGEEAVSPMCSTTALLVRLAHEVSQVWFEARHKSVDSSPVLETHQRTSRWEHSLSALEVMKINNAVVAPRQDMTIACNPNHCHHSINS